jgi:sphingolipid delta-4 desaturase
VGYHNEHHDFPYVAWSRLPKLKAAAPEFYDGLAQCDSWVGVIWDYILRDDVGPYNRVKRITTKDE